MFKVGDKVTINSDLNDPSHHIIKAGTPGIINYIDAGGPYPYKVVVEGWESLGPLSFKLEELLPPKQITITIKRRETPCSK